MVVFWGLISVFLLGYFLAWPWFPSMRAEANLGDDEWVMWMFSGLSYATVITLVVVGWRNR